MCKFIAKSLLLTSISVSTLHSLKFSWKIISEKFEEKNLYSMLWKFILFRNFQFVPIDINNVHDNNVFVLINRLIQMQNEYKYKNLMRKFMGKSSLITFLYEFISIFHSLKLSWKIISRKFEEKKISIPYYGNSFYAEMFNLCHWR